MTDTTLDSLPTSELLALYNDAAAKLGYDAVKRFSDRETAVRRTKFIRSQLNIAEAETAKKQAADKPKPAPKKTATQEAVADALKAGNTSPTPPVSGSSSVLPIASDNPAKDAEMPALRKKIKPTELKPKSKVYPRKVGTKQAILVDMLSRPQGATFGELYDALAAAGTPWRGVTIRSGIAWDMNSQAGYGITTELLTGEQMAAQGRTYEANRVGFGTPHYNPEFLQAVYRLTYPNGMDAPPPHAERATKPKAEPKPKA